MNSLSCKPCEANMTGFQDAQFADLIPGEVGAALDAYCAKNGWKLQMRREKATDLIMGYQLFLGKGVQVDNLYEYAFPYLYDREEALSFAHDFYARNVKGDS